MTNLALPEVIFQMNGLIRKFDDDIVHNLTARKILLGAYAVIIFSHTPIAFCVNFLNFLGCLLNRKNHMKFVYYFQGKLTITQSNFYTVCALVSHE